MESNKSQYFKYAIGETLLVVIGILIALYINNWNENSQKEESRQLLLLQLKEENVLNQKELQPDINYRDTIDVTLYKFHQFLKDGEIQEQDQRLKNYLGATLRSTVYNFSENYLKQYIREVRNENSTFTEELVALSSYQEALKIISLRSADYKFEKIFSKLSKEVDFETLNITDYNYIKSLEFRNDLLILENLEEAVYEAFDETINQQQKIDSMITVELK